MRPITKSELYVARLLAELPTHTKGGTAVEISDNGHTVITRSGRAWNNRSYSVYGPCDYPQLFGWDKERIFIVDKDNLEPSLEERITALEQYLGVTIERKPSKVVVKKIKKEK